MIEPVYLKFIDPNDSKKYYLYEYIRGTGEMATYRKGKVIGKKALFDVESKAEVPVGALKHMVHRGHKLSTYETQEELECELFLEAFDEY